jgi:hypothetical protein
MKTCPICGRDAKSKSSTYCGYGCGTLINRANEGPQSERPQRRQAVKEGWQDCAFRCYYTGIELETKKDKSNSPFYFTFDHPTPRSGDRIVACAQFINNMKTDTAEAEFEHNILKLAFRFLSGQRLRQEDFKLQHFSRNHTRRK